MATLETRGYVNAPEVKTTSGGKTYCKFRLGTKQKRKVDGAMVQENVSISCVDFSEGPFPAEGEYTGVTGYLTVSAWAKEGKNGYNLDLTVKSYEKIAQLPPRNGGTGGSGGKSDAPPADPFALG